MALRDFMVIVFNSALFLVSAYLVSDMLIVQLRDWELDRVAGRPTITALEKVIMNAKTLPPNTGEYISRGIEAGMNTIFPKDAGGYVDWQTGIPYDRVYELYELAFSKGADRGQAVKYALLFDHQAVHSRLLWPFPIPVYYIQALMIGKAYRYRLHPDNDDPPSHSVVSAESAAKLCQDVMTLVERGCDPFYGGPKQALYFAIRLGNSCLVDFLLKIGADVNAPLGAFNRTAIELAMTYHTDHTTKNVTKTASI